MKTWKQIWECRDISSIDNNNDDNILSKLIQADGFDGGGGDSCITAESWKDYIAMIKKELSIQENDSIFEVGCGCGAILYPLSQTGHQVGGIDYSGMLIKKAKELLPGANLSVCEALELDTQTKYDYVIANSMFFYFPDFEYASMVIDKMYAKARKGIAILDIPDARIEDILENERRKACPNYDEKYNGLKHLYYLKSWFLNFAELNNSDNIKISKQNIAKYGYNGLRFNCFIIK